MKTTEQTSPTISKTKPHPFWRWFWLTFLVVSLAYAWYSFYAPSNDIKWAKNSTTIQKLTNNSHKNRLIFFSGKWCSPCRIMKREVFADKEVAKEINSKITPVIIDIDDTNTKEIVKHYKVHGTPTTIIIDSEGKIIENILGKIEKNKFLEILSKLERNN